MTLPGTEDRRKEHHHLLLKKGINHKGICFSFFQGCSVFLKNSIFGISIGGILEFFIYRGLSYDCNAPVTSEFYHHARILTPSCESIHPDVAKSFLQHTHWQLRDSPIDCQKYNSISNAAVTFSRTGHMYLTISQPPFPFL